MDAVFSAAGQEHQREFPQRPRDVVHENVLGAVQHGGSQYRVRHAQIAEVIFQLPLAAEIREVRFRVGVGDADVNDASDSRFLCGSEHHLRLFNALLMGSASVVDADPVGVEQGVGAGQSLGQEVWTVEVERVQWYAVAERVVAAGMPGDGLDLVPLIQEQLGDVAAGVTGGAGDGVFVVLVHYFSHRVRRRVSVET